MWMTNVALSLRARCCCCCWSFALLGLSPSSVSKSSCRMLSWLPVNYLGTISVPGGRQSQLVVKIWKRSTDNCIFEMCDWTERLPLCEKNDISRVCEMQILTDHSIRFSQNSGRTFQAKAGGDHSPWIIPNLKCSHTNISYTGNHTLHKYSIMHYEKQV